MYVCVNFGQCRLQIIKIVVPIDYTKRSSSPFNNSLHLYANKAEEKVIHTYFLRLLGAY